MWNKRIFIRALRLLMRHLKFLFIFLIAIWALLSVWDKNEKYDSLKSTPIFIVGETANAGEDTNAVDFSGNENNRFPVSNIQALINPASLTPDQKDALKLALLDLTLLKIEGVSDLTNRLTEKLILQRDNKQDFLRAKIDELGLKNLKDKLEVLSEYKNSVSGPETSVNLETLVTDLRNKENGSRKSARETLNDESRFTARVNLIRVVEELGKDNYQGVVEKDTLYAAIGKKFEEIAPEKITISKYQNELENLSPRFDAIFTKISDSKESLAAAFKPKGWSDLAISIFDDSGQLQFLYKPLNMLLGFVALYSLFLFIIPLASLFPLSGYTEGIGQRIQDAFESGQAAAGPSLATPALAAAISAVGVGSVAIAGDSFDNAKRLIETPVPVASTELVRDPADTEAIKSIADSFEELSKSVRDLELPQGDTTVVELGPMVRVLNEINQNLKPSPDYTKAFDELLSRIGNPKETNQGQSVLGRIEAVDRKVGAPDQSNATRTLFGIIGKPEDSGSERTFFGRTNELKNVVERTYTVANETKSIADDTYNVARDTNEISADNWRNQAGRTGKNIVTQAKVLFTGERYAVSVVALRQIERQIGEYPTRDELQLISKLHDLNRSGSVMKWSELSSSLKGAAGDRTWKEWRSLVKRYTRVSRY